MADRFLFSHRQISVVTTTDFCQERSTHRGNFVTERRNLDNLRRLLRKKHSTSVFNTQKSVQHTQKSAYKTQTSLHVTQKSVKITQISVRRVTDICVHYTVPFQVSYTGRCAFDRFRGTDVSSSITMVSATAHSR